MCRMRPLRAVCCLCLLAAFARCVYSKKVTVPHGWTRVDQRPGDHERLTIVLGLKQSESAIGALKAHLDAVSNPHSSRYGKYLNQSTISNIVKPKEEHVQKVEAWIRSETSRSTRIQRMGGDALSFDASVKELEHMFRTTLSRYVCHLCTRGDAATTVHIRSDTPGTLYLPPSVSTFVDIVSPIYNFLPVTAMHRRPVHGINWSKSSSWARKVHNSDESAVVPETIQALYGIHKSPRTFGSRTAATQAVAEMQHVLGPEGFAASDLNMYQDSMHLPHSLIPMAVEGHNDGIDPTGECTLDTDLIGAVAQDEAPANTTFWMVDEWMYELGLALNSAKNPPMVVSISWGFSETQQCGPTDYGPDMPANCSLLGIHSNASYVSRVNVEFMKLGIRGITLVASSGDRGAPGSVNADCARDQVVTKALNPGFPAASPYVLSVGATSLFMSTPLDPKAENTPKPCKPALFFKGFVCAANGTEQVCSTETGGKITSGGGFSRYSPRPSWQADAVNAYLKNIKSTDLPPILAYNSSNRAFPDIAAIGHNLLIFLQGTGTQGWDLIDGTSASAPIWAAIVTRLNRARLAMGKNPLGFINPLLYGLYARPNKSTYFNDIPKGNNKCTTSSEGPTTDSCCKYGFVSAKDGWDPVSGLGTPNFSRLLEYVTKELR